MAEQFYTILTAIGKAKIANSSVLQEKFNLVKFKVGDSGGTYYNPTEDQEKLKNTVWEGPISSITVDENNPNWIVLQVMIPGSIGGFTIREAGVFDDEENLIAIGKYPETYKPTSTDGSTKDLVIKMILEVSNAASVTLKVDPTVILATKKDIDILENKIKNTVNEVINNNIKNIETKIEFIEKRIDYSDYIIKISKRDENGTPIEIQYIRNDGTLFQKAESSNVNSFSQYQKVLLTTYKDDGVTIVNKKQMTITYDKDGNIESKSRWVIV